MKYLKLFILLQCAMIGTIQAQNVVYNETDSLIFEDYVSQFVKQKDKPFRETLINTAKFFLGKPYVASTLEKSENESLIVNLREFDCTTFVENCIALTRTIRSGDTSFSNYCRILTDMRYRNGLIDGYTSRIHYTSDWIYENEERGLLKNISTDIGGKKAHHPVNFMSGHPQSYKHLKNNPGNIQKIKEVENLINKRNNYEIISLNSISRNIKNNQNGDIVVFATSIPGLDYSHIGIAYWQNENLHFIHASSLQKQVVIEKKTLTEYCYSSKNCSGISILRINNQVSDNERK